MKTRKIILFDGICNLCNQSVQFVIEHDKENLFQFASLQSDFGQDFLKKNQFELLNFNSIIYKEDLIWDQEQYKSQIWMLKSFWRY